MKLWVDDIRPAPSDWHWAKTVTEAIRILSTQFVEEVSLDHDIMHNIPRRVTIPPGCKTNMEAVCMLTDAADELQVPLACPETYEPVARYIAIMDPERRPKHVTIHTWNSEGGKVMAKILEGKTRVDVKMAKA